MRTAFITSEIFPYSKTGGLADVSSALPKALSKYIDIVCITPLYKTIDKSGFERLPFNFEVFGSQFSVYKDGSVYFLESDIFDKVYGYSNDEIRFGKFSYAVLRLFEYLGDFDIVHINDWQTSLLAFLLKESGYKGKVVLTIHNLAYQGIADKAIIDELNLGWENFTFDKLEFYDKVNFLKSGIIFSDKFNTVSNEYAKEIQTPTFCEGLGDIISSYSYRLRGIVNGIDYNEFNPENDNFVIQNYNYETINKKIINKRIVLANLKLKDEKKPLFAFIGRFTKQKGVDLIVNNADFLSRLPINIVMLGSGELDYMVEPLNRYDNIAVITGYNESLSRMIYASSEFFIMPSVFEPCGLSQIIAAAYGCIPIVSKTGGLIDTVDMDDKKKIFGFSFFVNHYDMFKERIIDAIELFNDREKYFHKAKENMLKRFSWDKSAKGYIEFYKEECRKPYKETEKAEAVPKCNIPYAYNENRVFSMNVNPNLNFIYWNLEEDLIKRYKDLSVVVFDDGKIIFNHKIKSRYGEYFLKYFNNMKKLNAYIGIIENGEFIDIIEKTKKEAKILLQAEIVKKHKFESKYFIRSGEL